MASFRWCFVFIGKHFLPFTFQITLSRCFAAAADFVSLSVRVVYFKSLPRLSVQLLCAAVRGFLHQRAAEHRGREGTLTVTSFSRDGRQGK